MSGRPLLYLDHAATSFPKPERVLRAVDRCLREVAGSPGRGGHAGSLAANRIVYEARERVARLLGIADASRVAFPGSATEALNIGILGSVDPGDELLVDDLSHNAVARPAAALAAAGVTVRELGLDPDPEACRRALERARGPRTRCIVVTHASNVDGRAVDLASIGRWCAEHGIRLGVDGAQSAGLLEVDVDGWGLGWFACSGHKGLHGPSGVGVLAVGTGDVPRPLLRGGTGTESGSDRQPTALPERFEPGTRNLPGIAGLSEGVAEILERGVERVGTELRALASLLADGLARIPGVEVFAAVRDRELAVPVVSFRVAGHDPSELAAALEDEVGALLRPGLHCAPRAHRRLGTFPEGTLRASPGPGQSAEQMATFVAAVDRLVRGERAR